MTRKPRPPIGDAPNFLRQRLRADGTWRVWWEPRAEDRALGFQAVALDAARPRWSVDQATRLNAELTLARDGGARPATRAGRTMSDLIAAYRRSVHFRTGLAAKSRDSYAKLLSQIEDKWGGRRVIDFDKPTMHAWYETLFFAKGARSAQALIRQMSILFSQAETLGWRPENSNPCFRLKIATPAPRERSASWAELDAMIAAAEALGYRAMALAVRIAVFQGQRQTDIRTAPRDAFRLTPVLHRADPEPRPTWVWTFRRSKRGNDGAVALHAEVIPSLRAALADAGSADDPRLPGDALLRDERLGRAYDEFLFARRWAEIRGAVAKQPGMAGVASLQFRDLRRTFGVLARAGGASTDDVGDVLGNSAASNPLLGETYMPASFTSASRAIAAVQRPHAREGKKE